MGNFLAQLKQRKAAHEATSAPKPVSEMTGDELDAALIEAKREVLNINREALQAATEAVQAKPRASFLPSKRRRNWR
jgi:hypothetical protein